MPHLESKTKLIMTVSVNKYINPINKSTPRFLGEEYYSDDVKKLVITSHNTSW